MDVHESYKITFQLLSLIKNLFIIVPGIIIISCIGAMLDFKNKKLREMFNYKDITNGLTTLFLLLVLSIPALIFCIARAVEFLKKTTAGVTYDPLVANVILPLSQAKAPVFQVIIGELIKSAPFAFPLLALTVIGVIVKWKDTAFKAMIIAGSLDLFLILVTHRFYMIYYELFGIRINY